MLSWADVPGRGDGAVLYAVVFVLVSAAEAGGRDLLEGAADGMFLTRS